MLPYPILWDFCQFGPYFSLILIQGHSITLLIIRLTWHRIQLNMKLLSWEKLLSFLRRYIPTFSLRDHEMSAEGLSESCVCFIL